NSTKTGNVLTGAGGVTADNLVPGEPVTVSVAGGVLNGDVWTVSSAGGSLTMHRLTGEFTYTSDVPGIVTVVAGNGQKAAWTAADIVTYGFDGSTPFLTAGTPGGGLIALSGGNNNVTGRNNGATDQGIGVETGGGTTGT